ncbi:MAG: hypothetical protein M1331_00080 [Candidatus Marsarchaeota archaeon]|nr:hypothetical protein [Candidatus Marsarchaeota archaeon]MCL5105785.1 hypothetical protein [Candidatus Marsarchaeota archaeon]
MKSNLATASRNSGASLYPKISEVFKSPIIVKRGRRNTEKLMKYALFMGFDKISIVSKTCEKGIIRINELRINAESKAQGYKSKIYFYDLNERKKIFLENKSTKGRASDQVYRHS